MMNEVKEFPVFDAADEIEEQEGEDEVATPEELRFSEDELLKALTEQEHLDVTETIEVNFANRVTFQFRIRPLSEREWNTCRERNTKYKKNRRLGGMKVVDDTDTVGYHSLLIYTATVDEDKEKLWNNKKLWKAVGALTGTDMVDKLIPYAGKKQQIVERIERLSGYDDESEDEYEETVKN